MSSQTFDELLSIISPTITFQDTDMKLYILLQDWHSIDCSMAGAYTLWDNSRT